LAGPTHVDDDRVITVGILRQNAQRSLKVRDLSPLKRSRFHTVCLICAKPRRLPGEACGQRWVPSRKWRLPSHRKSPDKRFNPACPCSALRRSKAAAAETRCKSRQRIARQPRSCRPPAPQASRRKCVSGLQRGRLSTRDATAFICAWNTGDLFENPEDLGPRVDAAELLCHGRCARPIIWLVQHSPDRFSQSF
jgi:hypothetical protein